MESTIEAERKSCSELAQRLSSKRREVAGRLNKQVANVLKELGISNGSFEVEIKNRPLNLESRRAGNAYVRLGKDYLETTPRGIDFVEFYISTNIGEDVKPLSKVASGGEISRVMLALKMILAKSDRLPLLVFDEIDIGISGRMAQKVGVCLKSLSNFHQIIAITHLPQIAGLADTHYVVEKFVDKKRATTGIRKLDLEERVREIAKLMSGEEITEASLRGARELMETK
jgi:DNA repair protein RecN (Recombination protein N)